MNLPMDTNSVVIPKADRPTASNRSSGSLLRFGIFTVCLILAFGKPLFDLLRYSLGSEMYSHILLIPVVSAYLIWVKRQDLVLLKGSSLVPAVLLMVLGGALAAGYLLQTALGWHPPTCDYLALTIASFLCFLWAGGLLFLGAQTLKPIAFPVVFLIFIVPFPTSVTQAIEYFFQHTSAEAANLMLKLTGMTMYREGLLFRLPGISITVAEECSGIRSSFVLFITGLLAGNLFLKSPWKKTLLAFAVIPLGILRNGFRIATIGSLCVYVDPTMIHSPIHHRGGPIFFALSLIPFFLFLLWLRRTERRPHE